MAPWWSRQSDPKAKQKTFHDKYHVGSKLGKGSFGQVYVAQRSGSVSGDTTHSKPIREELLAVKIVDMRNVQESRHHKSLQGEIAVWTKLKNRQNLVHLHEVFEEDDVFYMVMEKCDSSLLVRLNSLGDGLNERSLGEVFAQMVMGIKELHSLNIVHRDIKPDNFFAGGENGTTIKLGDFGLAIPTRDEKDGKPIGECGTAPYMSPEMVAREPYDEKSDVWSFGVLVYVLLFGRFPYIPEKNTIHDMKMAILDDVKVPDFGSVIPLTASAISFSMSLLDRDPKSRPSSADALKMAYMTAAMTNCDEIGQNMPSLRPTLRLAVKSRAFEYRILRRDGLDDMLEKMQIEKLGTPMVETPQHSCQSSMSAFASLIGNKPSSVNSKPTSRTSRKSTVVSIDLLSTIISVDSIVFTSLGKDVQRPWESSAARERTCVCDV